MRSSHLFQTWRFLHLYFLLPTVTLNAILINRNGILLERNNVNNDAEEKNNYVSSSDLIRLPLSYKNSSSRRLKEGSRDEQSKIEKLIGGRLDIGGGVVVVDLWVGNPEPQKQSLIIDTGSSMTAFPCENCNDCGSYKNHHTNGPFLQSESDSFNQTLCSQCMLGSCEEYNIDAYLRGTPRHQDRCIVEVGYEEGSSWEAIESSDMVSLSHPDFVSYDFTNENRNPQFELRFGCQTSLKGLFEVQTEDGIIGLNNEKESFWHQMYDQGLIKKKVFALCINSLQHKHESTGIITFGGTDERFHDSPMVYAESIENDAWFTVPITAIALKDSQSEKTVTVKYDIDKLNDAGTIIDSGTTDTKFPKMLKKPIKKAFKALTGNRLKLENISEEEAKEYPIIILYLGAARKVSAEELSRMTNQTARARLTGNRNHVLNIESEDEKIELNGDIDEDNLEEEELKQQRKLTEEINDDDSDSLDSDDENDNLDEESEELDSAESESELEEESRNFSDAENNEDEESESDVSDDEESEELDIAESKFEVEEKSRKLLEEENNEEDDDEEDEEDDESTSSDLEERRDEKRFYHEHDVILEIHPRQYLKLLPDGSYETTFDMTQEDEDGALMGTSFMAHFEILFDIENSRIGFAESKCEYDTYIK